MILPFASDTPNGRQISFYDCVMTLFGGIYP